MSIEKNKEDLKERLLKGRALSDDELAQVSGGGDQSPGNPCPYCGTALVYGGLQEEGNIHYSLCPNKNCPMNIEWANTHPSYLPWKLYYI